MYAVDTIKSIDPGIILLRYVPFKQVRHQQWKRMSVIKHIRC